MVRGRRVLLDTLGVISFVSSAFFSRSTALRHRFFLLIVLFWIYCGRIYHCTCTTRGGIMGGLDTWAGGEVPTYLSSGGAYSFFF